jgi:hypothetical protein
VALRELDRFRVEDEGVRLVRFRKELQQLPDEKGVWLLEGSWAVALILGAAGQGM